MSPRDAVTATVSTPSRLTASGTLVSEPTTGTDVASAASPGGMHAPTTLSPAYGSRSQLRDEVLDLGSRPPTTRTRCDHRLDRRRAWCSTLRATQRPSSSSPVPITNDSPKASRENWKRVM